MTKAGRPRSFDRQHAIENSMYIFWEHGYESTSLAMLKAAIHKGISAPSFYAAFTSKAKLFEEVVEHYMAIYGKILSQLTDPDVIPRTAIEAVLTQSAEMQTRPHQPKGCLLAVAATTVSPEHTEIQQQVRHYRRQVRNSFISCITRAIARGELPKTLDAEAFAAVFYGFLYGMSSQARDSVSLATLQKAIQQIMPLWESTAVGIPSRT